MKDIYKNISIIIIIIFFGFLFNYKYLNTFPYQIHAWAQSDRYALALGFTDNGLNFFKPQTFLYNHQFPDNWESASETTITAAEFPIHEYIPAVIMKLFNNNEVYIFRIYILLYSFIGLFFLFKLSYLWTNDYLKSLLILLLAATSPLFVYYQAGFLPSIPSLSNAIIGIYFYSLFLKRNKNKNFNISLIFLALAALSRSTFVIPLIAIFCVEFIRILKKDSKLSPKILPVVLLISILIINFVYNKNLKDNYGSIFLSQLMPAESISEFFSLIKLTMKNWLNVYFSKIHYITFLGIIVLSVIVLIINRSRLGKKKQYFLLYTLTIFIGCVMFLVALIKQFPAHDYYFLDSFFIPIILLMIYLLSIIPDFSSKIMNYGFWALLILVLIYPLSNKAIASQNERYAEKDWSRNEKTYKSFLNSEELLSELNILKDDKILVIDSPAPNMPFILMDRKGFVVKRVNKENIITALTWDYDYIIMQNEYYLKNVYTKYEEIINRIRKIGGDENLSVFILADEEQLPIFEALANYETELALPWSNVTSTDEASYSGSHAGLLTQEMMYGLTFKTDDFDFLSEKDHFLFFNTKLSCQYVTECFVVLSITHEGESIYYNTNNLEDLLSCSMSWEDLSIGFQIPKLEFDDCEFALYIYNPGESKLYIDDFWFTIY